MTRDFLILTSAFAFLALCAIAGYIAGGDPVSHCRAIGTVIKIGGLC